MSIECTAYSPRVGWTDAAGLFDEIDVDNFAGGGGVGMGFELATGKAFDHAINHDQAAIAMHKVNHPGTVHHCESVWDIDPVALAGESSVRLAWFSPDCKHFSRAKGSKPVEKKIRGLAWVAVRWAKRLTELGKGPRIIMLENVREFMDWGPLTADNMPDPARKRQTFKKFISTLRNIGYVVEWRVLDAADYGAPTHRRRLFVIARSDGLAIRWPEKTHGGHRGGRSVLQETQSEAIHEPSESEPTRSLALRHGSSRSGIRRVKTVGCSSRQHERIGDSNRVETAIKPFRTAAECIDWTIPCPSIFERKRPLAEKTLRRIALGIIRFVVNNPKPFIMPVNHGDGWKNGGVRVRDIERPGPTLTSNHSDAVVVPSLIQVGYGERPTKTKCKACGWTTRVGADGCQCPKCGAELGLVTTYGQAPRSIDIKKPLGTVVASGKHALVSAMVAKFRGDSTGQAIDQPCPTITSGCGAKRPAGAAHALAVTSATLVGVGGRGGQSPPKGVDEPHGTITAKADRGLAVATLTQFRGSNGGNGGDVDAPAPAITAGGRNIGLVAAFLTKYYGQGLGSAADKPMATATVKHRFALVTVKLDNGEDGVLVKVPGHGDFVIADIGLRMLTPRELARCQGFPDSYVLTGTQANQVARIGNSVPPPIVEALVRANVGEG